MATTKQLASPDRLARARGRFVGLADRLGRRLLAHERHTAEQERVAEAAARARGETFAPALPDVEFRATFDSYVRAMRVVMSEERARTDTQPPKYTQEQLEQMREELRRRYIDELTVDDLLGEIAKRRTAQPLDKES